LENHVRHGAFVRHARLDAFGHELGRRDFAFLEVAVGRALLIAPSEPMPRITLKRRPSSRNDSPGLFFGAASIEPIITLAAPRASAFDHVPRGYFTPPSGDHGHIARTPHGIDDPR